MEKVLRILVVEDSEDDMLLMMHQIETYGYKVDYERVDTVEKMKIALKLKWDIILSDYRMPHFNGLEALKIFQETGSDIPFIIISGTIGEETAVEAMKAGAHDYIMKNNLYRLLPAIEREIRESNIRAEKKGLEQKQKQAEILKASEEELRNLVRDMPVGVILRGPNAEVLLSNTQALELLGLTEEQLQGKTSFDGGWNVIHEDGSPYPLHTFPAYKALAERRCVWGEVMGVNRPVKGDIVWLLVDAIPQLNSDGSVKQVISTFKDISKQKIAEEKLIKLTTAVEQSPVSIIVTNKKGIIEYANPFSTYNTGYKNEEIIGKKPSMFKSGFTSNEIYKKLWETISSGNIWKGELCNKKKNGDLYWESVSISPVKNSNEEITHYIGIKEDITDQKRALKALHESEDRYRRLVEMSPDAIAIHQHGNIVFINPAGAKLFGAQLPQDMIGMPVINLVHPDYRENVIERIQRTLSGEKAPYIEEKFIKIDGTLLDVEVTAIPAVFQGIPATQVVVRDITERKNAEAEIKLKNDELLKLNAEKDKFFSIIAHDLRSPFVGFLGLTEVMVENLDTLTAEKIRTYALGLHDSAVSIFSLLENLLEWAKVHRGLIPFEPELLHLYPVVEECLVTLKEPSQKKGIKITTDILPQLTVLADNNMIKSVVRNLVSNAIKFTPHDGKITISAKAINNESVEIAIKDTGIGMCNEMADKLFQLHAKTNRPGTDDEPSSGLGLILCKEFIEKHGGRIWVESEEGKGSTFFFTIPVNKQKM